jgi:uncharacterized protein
MILEGVVTNVAAFGAFVDIGVHQDGLVHISAMSTNFVKDPRAVAKPGDIVKVKVLDVERARNRIALSMRLTDEPGKAAARPEKNPAALGETAPRQAAPAGPGGALAEALRRAGLHSKG